MRRRFFCVVVVFLLLISGRSFWSRWWSVEVKKSIAGAVIGIVFGIIGLIILVVLALWLTKWCIQRRYGIEMPVDVVHWRRAGGACPGNGCGALITCWWVPILYII